MSAIGKGIKAVKKGAKKLSESDFSKKLTNWMDKVQEYDKKININEFGNHVNGESAAAEKKSKYYYTLIDKAIEKRYPKNKQVKHEILSDLYKKHDIPFSPYISKDAAIDSKKEADDVINALNKRQSQLDEAKMPEAKSTEEDGFIYDINPDDDKDIPADLMNEFHNLTKKMTASQKALDKLVDKGELFVEDGRFKIADNKVLSLKAKQKLDNYNKQKKSVEDYYNKNAKVLTDEEKADVSMLMDTPYENDFSLSKDINKKSEPPMKEGLPQNLVGYGDEGTFTGVPQGKQKIAGHKRLLNKDKAGMTKLFNEKSALQQKLREVNSRDNPEEYAKLNQEIIDKDKEITSYFDDKSEFARSRTKEDKTKAVDEVEEDLNIGITESPVRTQMNKNLNEVPDNTKASDKELEKMTWKGEGEEPDVMDIGRPEPEVKESKLRKDLNKKPDEAEIQGPEFKEMQGPKVQEDAKDKAAIKEVSKLQEKLNPETSTGNDSFPKGNWRDAIKNNKLKTAVGGAVLGTGTYSLFDKDKESKYNLGLDQPGSLDKPGGQISTLSKDDKKGGGTGDGNNNIVTPQIPEPESLDSLMKKINGMTVGMSADQKELFKKQFDDLEELKNKVTGEYKKEKDNLAMAELVTDVANSLTQLFAGAYGLKHGVDMSGLKFKQTDWSAKLDSAKEDLNKRLADISKGEESLSKQQSDILERQEKDKDFKAKLMIKEWMQQKRDYNKSLMQLDKLNKQAAMAKQKKDPNAKGYERAALEAEKNLISPLQRDVALIEDVQQKLLGLQNDEVNEEQVYNSILKLPVPVLKELEKELGEPKWFANLFRGKEEPIKKEILTSGVLENLTPFLEVKSNAKQNLIKAAQDRRQSILKSGGQSALPSENKEEIIEDGYRFLGGDKSDPANWEKI